MGQGHASTSKCKCTLVVEEYHEQDIMRGEVLGESSTEVYKLNQETHDGGEALDQSHYLLCNN